MPNVHDILTTLRRPRLLVRAARHGLHDYNRRRDLNRLTGQNARASTRSIVENLVEQEEQLEETRKAGDAAYRASHHIELLVALMAECQLLPRATQS
ncbi:DUF6477 family protein [uncultured Litoreibacter sp.]|uniref:DUF6477 family protein n=1 Tax=uncultured Litoreibacter sp. TaxID=1392394 RepID=UPI00263A1F13|nr:DUF6477 family protein [uncultured Litoreibacter sp.]